MTKAQGRATEGEGPYHFHFSTGRSAEMVDSRFIDAPFLRSQR